MTTMHALLSCGRYLLVAALLLSACSDKGSTPAPAVVANKSVVDAVSKAPAEDPLAPTIPAPELTISLRGVGDDVVEQGEPLRIVVRLAAPRASADIFELAPTSGTWSDAITVELAPAGGGTAVASAAAIGKPALPNATLDAKRIAGGLWLISSETMQKVAPGDFLVRGRLAIKDGSGWHGEVTSDEMPLQVVAVSDAPYRVSQRTVNQAHAALLTGHSEEAATLIDEVLQQNPDDVRLLTVRADIAERAGNPMAALICLHRAQQAQAVSTVGQPMFEQAEIETRARAALADDKKPLEQPPAWTWPPAAVLAVPDDEILGIVETEALSKPAPEAAAQPVAALATSAPALSTPVVVPSPALVPASSSPAKEGEAGDGTVVPANKFTDPKVIADAAGQWAVSAIAGSQYGKTQYSAVQAVGTPNVTMAGNSPDAWCPEKQSDGSDWLEVTFAQPVHATEVRVRQNDSVGAIIKVEALEPNGTTHIWWEGVDPYQPPAARDITWFGVRVPKTSYLVAKVKITLNLAAVPGWKEIDAVQLVGTKD